MKFNPFKDFQFDQIQGGSRKILTAHCACWNADLNLTLVTGRTKGFIFQIINSLIESLIESIKKTKSWKIIALSQSEARKQSSRQPPLNCLSWGRLGTKRERRRPWKMAESLNDWGKQDLTSLYLIFDQFICNIYCSVFPLDVFFNWRVSECTFKPRMEI